MSIRDFESVKNWFEKGGYTKSTEKTYLNDLSLFCAFLRENPDTLVTLIRESSNPQAQIQTIVKDLADYMDSKLHLHATTVHNDLSGLYSFLRANGIPITNDDIGRIHEGIKILRFRKM